MEQSHPPTCTHEGDFSVLNTAIVEIKDTLKDLKDVLTSNAVLAEQVNSIKETLSTVDIRVRKVELDIAQHRGSDKWIEKVIWCLLSAALGFYLKGEF